MLLLVLISRVLLLFVLASLVLSSSESGHTPSLFLYYNYC
jgi:hypothetical protein